MIKNLMCILFLIGILGVLSACDGPEQPFIVTNTLSQPVYFQVLVQSAANKAGFPTDVARESQTYQSREPLVPGETASIFVAGVFGGRVGYIVIISDENGTELFRNTFPRDELIQRKFKLTITEQGIDYSP